jgi:hypothetical protein
MEIMGDQLAAKQCLVAAVKQKTNTLKEQRKAPMGANSNYRTGRTVKNAIPKKSVWRSLYQYQ